MDNLKTLYLDDNEKLNLDIAKSVAQLVAKKGFQAAMTTSGEAAIRQFDAPVSKDWTLIRIRKASCSTEGSPAGWSKVRREVAPRS